MEPTAAPTLAEALHAATETRCLEIGPGVIHHTPRIFKSQFGAQPAIIVADYDTFRAAGQTVTDDFRTAGQSMLEPFLFPDPDLYAEHRYVTELEQVLGRHNAIPIAVGSGTINDMTKLAVHRLNRPYMAVATAASMDGYTAFGASITFQGSKQTFPCGAPVAVVADLDVIDAAPPEMNAWGYADLLAKIPAGADWIIADAFGVEPIHPQAWAIAQGRLRENVADPSSTGRLIEGLMLCGLAMQACRNSRAASGAEHQFSHLWDMQRHTYHGRAPSHGFKVGIGTLAMAAFYERLLELPLHEVSTDALCAAWPDEWQWQTTARRLLGHGALGDVAAAEIQAKAGGPEALREQLLWLRGNWPALRNRLRAQLMSFAELRQLLQSAGAPVEPEHIGISRQRLRDSFWPAFLMRRRFTALDLAARAGVFDQCVNEIFSPRGPWPVSA